MRSITRTNRHQPFFSTLEEQVSTDNPVRLVDAFLGVLHGKKKQRCLQGTLRPAVEKGKNKKLAIIAVCNKLLAPVSAG